MTCFQIKHIRKYIFYYKSFKIGKTYTKSKKIKLDSFSFPNKKDVDNNCKYINVFTMEAGVQLIY